MTRRTFSPEDDALIHRAHAGTLHMRDLAKALRAALGTIYRRMEEMDLPRRKPHPHRMEWRA